MEHLQTQYLAGKHIYFIGIFTVEKLYGSLIADLVLQPANHDNCEESTNHDDCEEVINHDDHRRSKYKSNHGHCEDKTNHVDCCGMIALVGDTNVA